MKLSIRVTTKAQTEFWIRALKLESKIDWARGQLIGPRRQVTMPIIAEYVIDSSFKWVYCLVFIVDSLGLKNGFGFCYACDANPADQKDVYDRRDRLADQLLAELEKGPGIDEMHTIPEGKEYEETNLPLTQPGRPQTSPEDPPDRNP
jgi:hypothetical protein